MIQRLKDGKVYDFIKFNQSEDKCLKRSDDILAADIKVKKITIFGLEAQETQTYSFHEYYTTQFLSKTVGTVLIKQFIAGYYGIMEEYIIDYKETDDVISFSISEQYQLLSPIERQQKLGSYKQMSEQIKIFAPKYEEFNYIIKSKTMFFKNCIDEKEYKNIFNQLEIRHYTTDIDFYITCVKYNNNYKGKVYYPMKFYQDIPVLEDNSLLIQLATNNILLTYMFRQEKMIVIQQLTFDDGPLFNPLRFNLKYPIKNTSQYQIQLYYGKQTQKQVINKIPQLSFIPYWRKTHGNQYLLTGIKHTSQYYPKIKLIFLETYIQIQCETDNIDTAIFNFTILYNFFNLEKQTIQRKKTEYDLTNVGTPQFDLSQIRYVQESQLDDLQLVDPISYGVDDRYEYQKLVTDTQKRPVQIQYQLNFIDIFGRYKGGNIENKNENKSENETENENKNKTNESETNEKEDKNETESENESEDESEDESEKEDEKEDKKEDKKEKEKEKVNETKVMDDVNDETDYEMFGGAKGSPVYINKQYDYSQFLLFQHHIIINGFGLRNQTFNGMMNRYRCSQEFPYLLLGNTKGKDSISCAKSPINQYGISIFEFYDVGLRLSTFSRYLDYLRPFLFGRVSLSATKFSQWIIPGRCSEMPLNLKKHLAHNTLLLSLLEKIETSIQLSDTIKKLKPDFDWEWFESVFGKKYKDIFDGDIVYDYFDDQFYSSNVNGKNMAMWIKFPNHKKYLIIKDEIKIEYVDGKKQHFYVPFIYTDKQFQQQRQFDLNFYKKFTPKGYISINGSTNYLVTNKGAFPFKDSTYGLKLLDIYVEQCLPKYETVKDIVQDTDNYIINYRNKIIGTKYSDLFFYWKETTFETNQKLTIGTYPLPYKPQQREIYPPGFDHYYKTVAYHILHYIITYKYISDDESIVKLKSETDVEMLEEILSSNQKAMQVLNYFGAISNTDQFLHYYKYQQIPILSILTKAQAEDGLDKLKQLLPKNSQMKLDYVQKLATFSNDKDLVYDPVMKEELLKLNIKQDYDDYQ